MVTADETDSSQPDAVECSLYKKHRSIDLKLVIFQSINHINHN